MKYLYQLSFFIITFSLSCNTLLQKPELLTVQDIQVLENTWETQFTWDFGKGCNFTCSYEKGESSFILQLLGVPLYSYNYPYITNIKKLFFDVAGSQYGYYFAPPLRYKESLAHQISFEELCEFLENKRFIFYTGAGISAAGNVATMKSLEQSLKIDKGLASFLKEAIFRQADIASSFSEFCKSAIYKDPTPAHWALHQIAQERNVSIVTENVDLLQHRTGSKPIFIHSDILYSVTASEYAQIDVLVCIGLSHDDCGFIANYKRNNPQGCIIAIDLGNPNYLSSNDYIVQEDIQVISPKMAQFFCV